jgi:hypothetical protein
VLGMNSKIVTTMMLLTINIETDHGGDNDDYDENKDKENNDFWIWQL